MAVTPFQGEILRLLATDRKCRGESYTAGGVALNILLSASRISRDIDLFHDTDEALAVTWATDKRILDKNGYAIQTLREASSFIEALISRGADHTSIQWARDSAFRFFPLIEDDLLGLALHPFDLATNKVLAMAGRLEVRDWIDMLHCDRQLQPFGYLIWAACGKDPGYNPQSLLSTARRMHYSHAEIQTLEFEGDAPDAQILGKRWHDAIDEATLVLDLLPAEHVGECVLNKQLELYQGSAGELKEDVDSGTLIYHEGSIGGSWPVLID